MESITIAAATHVGMKRKQNQDYHAYYSPESGSKKGTLLALADGMGGRAGGAIASKIAVDVLMEEYYKESLHSIPESLEKAFLRSNADVLARGNNDIDLQGMATTLTAVVLREDKLYYAHVGDSRGYLIHKDKISQFTEDHSLVAGLVKAGHITKEQAAEHPEKNIITRAIGLESDLHVDAPRKHKTLKKDQYVLLCCDGLHGVVPDEEILRTVNEFQTPDIICKKLIARANENGGPDNITVLIARVDRVSLKSRFMNFMR